VKVVVGMIISCSLLGSIQPYLWAYNPTTGQCSPRPNTEKLWEVWSWTTELIVFLVVPLVILIINVLVMREVWRMSSSGPAVAAPAAPPSAAGGVAVRNARVHRQSSVHAGTATSSKNAATNAMLLTVSFYVIFTTLPATLVYVLANVFPEARPPAPPGACAGATAMTPAAAAAAHDGDSAMAAWRRYVVFITVRNVVNEICLSHYACNFFFYVVTGSKFRESLRRLCCRSDADAVRDTENGTARGARSSVERSHGAAAQHRTLLARL